MLSNRSHWHFAFVPEPEKERRLCAFANDDDDGNTGNLESAPENLPQNGEQESESIRGIRAKIAGHANMLKSGADEPSLIAMGTVNSLFVLNQALNFMDDERLKQKIRQRMQELKAGRGYTKLGMELAKEIEALTYDPAIVLQLSQAFEKQLDFYKQLHDEIGDERVLAGATAVEMDLVLMAENAYGEKLDTEEAKKYMLSNSEAWSQADAQKRLEGMLSRLNIAKEIPLPEVTDDMDRDTRKAIEAAHKQILLSKDDIDENGKPKTAFLLRMIQAKLSGARKLIEAEKNDLGTESTHATFGDVEKKMWKQHKHIRMHLERLVLQKAAKMAKQVKEKLQWAVSECNSEQSAKALEKKLGVSPLHLLRRIGDISVPLQNALRIPVLINNKPNSDGNYVKALDGGFLGQTGALLSKFEWIEEILSKETKEEAVAFATEDLKLLEQERLEWIQDIQPRLVQANAISSQKDIRGLAEKYSTYIGKTRDELSMEEGEELTELTLQEMRTVETMIATIVDPKKRAIHAEGVGDRSQKMEEMEGTPQEFLRTVEKLNALKSEILDNEHLSHEVCNGLGIVTKLRNIFVQAQQKLHSAGAPNAGEKGKESLAEVLVLADQLQHIASDLAHVSDKPVLYLRAFEFAQQTNGSKAMGYYKKATGQIYVNITATEKEDREKGYEQGTANKRVVHHELGHALVDILVRKGSPLYGILLDSYDTFAGTEITNKNGSTTTFDELLRTMAKKWKVSEDDKETLMDELWNQYGTWVNGGRKKKSIPALDKLVRMLDEHVQGNKPEEETLGLDPDLLKPEGMELGDIDEEANEAEGEKDVVIDKSENTLVTSIDEVKAMIASVDAFLVSYPNLAEKEALKMWNERNKQRFDRTIMTPFNKNEDSKTISNNIESMKTDMKGVLDSIALFNKNQLNVSDAPATGRTGWKAVFAHVEFVSIFDLIQMVKSGAEDIQRMWKRRGQRVQSNFGKLLTGMIPDNDIWGLAYLGQLKHEFQRRNADSEVEEVEQWKKAFKDLDSFQLLDYLAISRNKDQVRALSEILSERGRLDFNDERFWNTLNALSNYQMPIDACRNNDVLRDKWLQKLIADIWGDKDKYFDWRQSNDNGIDSGKKKFTQTTDQLSNVKRGLSDTLKKQLELWVKAKENGETPPEEINPLLYEEILHYAMRNGKMTMEQKLFYLVQGVRYRLLSIDRLRTLAGDNGGILNRFPFIDYFYGHNNSLAEVTALGRRLEEGGDRFKPGAKTTLWIHLELTRDEGAQVRMSKAVSGERTQSLDHEDIPTIISQADYKMVEELSGLLSGDRFKISPEAVKNAYTGFGTKFKVLAKLAELDSKNEARFSAQDAQEAAKSIAAYIHMDNIFTRNGSDGKRPELTWQQINNSSPVSGGPGLKIKDYRDGSQGLVHAVLDSGILTPDIWDKISEGRNSVITKDNIARRDEQQVDTKTQTDRWNAMKLFEQELAKALSKKENQDKLKHILRDLQNTFKEEGEGVRSLDEEDQYLKSSIMREYMNERREQIFQKDYNHPEIFPT